MQNARGVLRNASIMVALATLPLSASAVEIIEGPILTVNPTGATPLAGIVELETDTAVEVELTVSGGADVWSVRFADAAHVHQLPVLGLKPDRTYTVDVELIPGGFAGSLMAVTDPLPDDFPTLVTVASDPVDMEPGFTLIDCFQRATDDSRPRYSMIVDSAGEVVWYSTICSWPIRQLANGNLFYRDGSNAVEVDLLGNTKAVVTLNTPGPLHHDLLPSVHGTYLSLFQESVQVQDYPTSETDPDAPTAEATVRDTPVVEFLPDGTLRNVWPMTEIIDPTRIGYDSLRSAPFGLNWVHGNAVVYDEGDDSIIASLRHQDAVIKFARSTGELVWILGPHDGWSPEFQPFLLHPIGTPFRWSYHQHAPMITGDGTLVLYDNGNRRASPFDGNPPVPDSENFSRGVEYEIDEAAMEVRQAWEYGEDIQDRLYSPSRGDADWLEMTGNVMMTYSSITYVGGVTSASLGLGVRHSRIVEATEDVVPERVFELLLYDSAGGWILVYRSERIPSLYPLENGLVRYVRAPNGVGDTLMVDKISGSIPLEWTASPVDPTHDAADHYVAYVSSSPDSGFTILDSTAHTSAPTSGANETKFYKVVAANTAGTSNDQPPP